MHRLLSPTLALCLWLLTPAARADVAVPRNVLEPSTVVEAWNVIGLVTKNIETLLAQKRAEEVVPQVSLCSPALRTLARLAISSDTKAKLDELTVRAFGFINTTAAGGLAQDLARAEFGYTGLKGVLAEIAALYDPKVVAAPIFFCPAHPEFISKEGPMPCGTCRLPLAPRRIPYSFVYVAPGEPTIQLTATADAPLEAGRKATVKLGLRRRDGTPVLLKELMVLHGLPMHLLLADSGLREMQHAHPAETETPGEYTFTFTPARTTPYRLWVEVTPAATGVQEYPWIDLPSPGAAEPIGERADNFTSTVGGLNFRLSFDDRRGGRPRAGETRFLRVTVTDAAGQPVNRLAPVMRAFAHLRCFADDYRTTLHFHPEGGEILRDDVLAGPVIGFKIFAPKPGFLRVFCQVSVDGQMLSAPFTVNVGE